MSGCPECSDSPKYLGDEDDGTPIFQCRLCGVVFEGCVD